MTKIKHPHSRGERRRLNEKNKGRTYKVRRNVETGEKEAPDEFQGPNFRGDGEGKPPIRFPLYD